MIPVRRLGSGVIHWADIDPEDTVPVTVFGSEGRAVAPPVVTSCGALLNGTVVVMTSFRFARSCSRCRRNPAVADAARALEGMRT